MPFYVKTKPNGITQCEYWCKNDGVSAILCGRPPKFGRKTEFVPYQQLILPLKPYMLGFNSLHELVDSYETGALDKFITPGDEIYGLPQEWAPMLVFYNNQLFEESGLLLPKTPDEFIQVARRLTKRTPDGGMERAGFSWSWSYYLVNMFQWDALMKSYSGSGTFLRFPPIAKVISAFCRASVGKCSLPSSV